MAKHTQKRQRDKKQRNPDKRTASAPLLRSQRVRSTLAFTLSCICFYAIIFMLPESFFRPLNEQVAACLGLVLHALGFSVTTVHDMVSDNTVAFKIIPECTPIFTAGLFLSFVLFHPATVKQKAIGLAAGLPALYLGNLLRLMLTFMAARHNQRLFEVAHVYLGQVFSILLVILICLAWMRWTAQEEPKQGPSIPVADFVGRFVLISGCLFLVWAVVHHSYIRLLDWFMRFGFSLFNHHVALARHTALYYETFSFVPFTALALALTTVPWSRKITGYLAGLGLLFAMRLFHRTNNVLLAYFSITAATSFDMTLLVLGQYLLPVLLFLHITRCRGTGSRTGAAKAC